MKAISAEEAQHLHEALDEAISLRQQLAEKGSADQQRLVAMVLAHIAAPLAGDALTALVDDVPAEQLAGDCPPDDRWTGLGSYFSDKERGMARVRASRDALSRSLLELETLLPPGFARAVTVSLQALNRDEEHWLARISRGKGVRAKNYTKEQFALIFCREVAFLRGVNGWSKDRSFFELTGNRPRRAKSIKRSQARTLSQPPVKTLLHDAFTLLEKLVPKDSLDVALKAGEAKRTGRELRPEELLFVEKREQRSAAYAGGTLDTMWGSIQGGAKADSGE